MDLKGWTKDGDETYKTKKTDLLGTTVTETGKEEVDRSGSGSLVTRS